MDQLNTFVITLVTTLIFMTAVELIGPDNSMKKYLKFVLGIVLISVLLNPIVKFFTNGQVIIDDLINDYTSEVSSAAYKKDTEEKKSIQEDTFKKNFNKSCIDLLEDKFKNYEFKSDIDCNMNFETGEFEVKKLKVSVKNKGVKKVEKIQIGEEKKKTKDKILNEIEDYLAENLKIDKDKIEADYV